MGYPFLETTTWFKFHQTCPGGAVNSWASLEATWMLGHVKSGKWQGKKRGKKPDLDWTWFFTWFFTCERGSVSDLVFQSVSICSNQFQSSNRQNHSEWPPLGWQFRPESVRAPQPCWNGSPTLEGWTKEPTAAGLPLASTSAGPGRRFRAKKNGWMMVNDSRIKPALPSDPRDLFWDILSVRLLQSKPSRAWMALTASSCACKLQPEAPEWFVVLHLNIFNTSTTEEMLNFVQFCLQRQWHPMTNGLPCLAKFNQEMAWKAAVATMPRELIAPAALVSKLGHCKMIEARKQVSNLLILPNTS